jgi:two-component system osmolarity sensor histidine kinase EnvZ
MSSSRIDAARTGAARTGAAPAAPSPAAGLRIPLKRMLPRTLLGRSLLIIVTPLILLQLIASWFFFDRHWEIVSRRFASDVAGDIALVVETIGQTRSPEELSQYFDVAADATEIDFTLTPGAALTPPQQPVTDSFADPLAKALNERVRQPFVLDAATADPRDVLIVLQLPGATLSAATPRKRLYTSTTYIFVLWMVGSSVVLFAIATMFMRNQVRSLKRLAAAADSFGKGRSVSAFRLEGAAEIRQAGAAFLAMRDRVQRQISQRTEMLAGVSHDLRTPLTRMKLALALLSEGMAVDELKSDVAEMERMVQGYLDFARGEGAETPVEADLRLFLEDIVAAAKRQGADVTLTAPEECVLPLRPNAMRRCLDNLVGNALRHGSHVWLTALPMREAVEILVDDDGPGIPEEQREAAFRPFVRLDASRNAATGGVGLGLTIARDVARGHGGDLTLEASPQGGLRARVHIPL